MKKNNRIALFFKQAGIEMPGDKKISKRLADAAFWGFVLYGLAAVVTAIAHLVHGF